MRTLLLETTLKILIPLFIVFALIMFLRGHDKPGGGFIAGLTVAIPFMVHTMTFGPAATQLKYRIKPIFLAASGLLLALLSSIFSLFAGKPFMQGLWTEIPVMGKIGTPVLFDAGVLMIVFGMVMKVMFLFAQKQE